MIGYNSTVHACVVGEIETERNETAHNAARTWRYPNHNVETQVSNRIYREVTGWVVDMKWSGADAGIMKGSKLRRGVTGGAE